MSDDDGQPTAKKAKRARDVTHVLAYDWEMTGMNLHEHWPPEFGAALWKIGEKKPEATFYRCIKQPAGTVWCHKTLDQFWNNPAKGAEPDKGDAGETPMQSLEKRRAKETLHELSDVMFDFVAWARTLENSVAGSGGCVVAISDTGAFDGAVTNFNLALYCGDICDNISELFGPYRPVRDITSFYYGFSKRLQKFGSDETLLDALGEKEFPDWVQAYAHNHDPLSDSNHIGAKASYVLSKCE
jgi:hypothetical protein